MRKDITYRFYQYANHAHSFVPDLLPEVAMQILPNQVFYLLSKRYGEDKTSQAFDFQYNIVSPVHSEATSDFNHSEVASE